MIKTKVLGIGDNVCDKYMHSGIMYPGGQALNFSVYAKILGADSSYMGVFGTDDVAKHIIKTLDSLNIDHKRCRQYQGENGYAKISLVNGDRVFLSSNKGGIVNKYPIQLNADDIEYIKHFSLIHTSNNSHLNSQLPILKEIGIPISYDFSCCWKQKEFLLEVAPYITFAFLSCGSIQQDEIEKICRNIFSYGCKLVIATRGKLGSVVYNGKNFFFQNSKFVEPIDTLGAGDSYATAFLLSIIENIKNSNYDDGSIKKAMEHGADFASKICMTQGAFGHGIPFKE